MTSSRLRLSGAISAVLGLLSTSVTPLFAQAQSAVRSATPKSTFTIEWFGKRNERVTTLARRYQGSQSQQVGSITVNINELREKIALLKATPQRIEAHLKKLIRIHDAYIKSQTRAERHDAVRALGVTVSKQPTDEGIVSTFSIDGKPRLRIVSPAFRRVHARPFAGTERPDGAGHDDGQDLMDAEIAAAEQEADDFIIWATATAEQNEALAEEIANTDWGSEGGVCDEVQSGPAANDSGEASCWSEAFEALLSAIGAAEASRQAINTIRGYWNDFQTAAGAARAAAIAGTMAAAEYSTVISGAIATLIAAVSWQAILIGAGLAAVGYFGYKLYECYTLPALSLAMTFARPVEPDVVSPEIVFAAGVTMEPYGG